MGERSPEVESDDPPTGAISLSVLLPCHNEAATVAKNLADTVLTVREQYLFPFEVLLVDDGSTDGTAERAEEVMSAFPEIRVVRIPSNGGKGGALRLAFERARGDRICFLDGDLDIHPRHIAPLVHILDADSVHVVIGSKRHPDSRIDYPRERRILSGLFELFVRSLFGLRLRDTQAGIKVFRREVLAGVFPKGLEKRYAFDVELLVLADRLGYKVEEAPIEMSFTQKFGSGVSLLEIVRMFFDTLGIFYRVHITKYYEGKSAHLERST